MQSLLKDLKVGLRGLRRMPGSAVISVVVLALGIGLCSFGFSLVYGVYFRGLDLPDADRFVVLFATNPEEGEGRRPARLHEFLDWSERQRSFTGMLAVAEGTVNLSDGREPHRFYGAFVTANAFDLIGVRPVLGRSLVEGEDVPGSPPNVILSHSAWRDQYGLDPDVLGRAVRVNGEPAEIIGVMPEGFRFPENHDLWMPLREDPLATPRGEGRFVQVYARLRPGVDRERAELEMASVAEQLGRDYPETSEGVKILVQDPVKAASGGEIALVFGAMMIAVLCVLLVACANVANLLLARAALRTKEAGVRVALGGSRFRVMSPFFAEALVLAAAGAVLGIFIAWVAVGWFDGVTDPARTGRPYFIRFELDAAILAFVAGVTVLTALVAGLAPALKMSRTDVSSILKDESRGSSSLRMGRLTGVLVNAEVALSCALLVGAGLMTKSIVNLGQTEYLFETERLFTARVGLFETDYPDRAARQRLWEDLLREIQAVPTVASAALTTNIPMDGVQRLRVAFEGERYEDEDALPRIGRVIVTPGYFRTLGVEFTAGRDFVEQDDAGSNRVAIVNRSMVERYFGGRSPLGLGFREGASDTLPLVTVVGVVPDVASSSPTAQSSESFEPAAYWVPLRQQDPSFMNIAVLPRAGEALALTPDIRGAVRRADADLPIYNVRTQAEQIDRATWFYGVFGTVFIVFGLAALFMASVGLYGVLSFAVSRRTQEMGIRMALGAGAGDVVRLVARQGAAQLGIGLGVGMALAFGVTRLIGILMYRVDPQDPYVFGGVVATIVLVGMAASVFPALRATGVDPTEALRSE